MSNREPGLYWVQIDLSDDPEPALWLGGEWQVLGTDEAFNDDDFDLIDEARIIPRSTIGTEETK